MRAEIWMGGNLVVKVEVKRIDILDEGLFVKITDVTGASYEASPHNILLIHDKKYDEEE